MTAIKYARITIMVMLMFFIGTEVSLVYMDMVPDSIVEFADFGEKGCETDQKDEKEKEDYLSDFLISSSTFSNNTGINHLSLPVYKEVFKVIPTPPPNS